MRRPKFRKAPQSPAVAKPTPQEYVRFVCPCGATCRIPAWRVDSHGLCPRCKRRLLLAGKTDAAGRITIHPMLLNDSAKASGQTFMIEDHFKELPDLPEKIGFHCPCGFKLFARPGMLDKRGKCPHCGARLLLVGKQNPRTQQLEIHPLVVEEPPSGDTQMFEG